MDNQVPTPASEADTHPQPEIPVTLLKTQPEEEKPDLEGGKKQPEIKSEVGNLRRSV